MKKRKIGRIIFAKVLEMPLSKYVAYIEKTVSSALSESHNYKLWRKESKVNGGGNSKMKLYAKLMIKDRILDFEVMDKSLENIYPVEKHAGDKTICSLKWINTRNRFSRYILKGLLHYQSKYWFGGRKTDIKPLTFKQFLSLYPQKYLDRSRLSRLIANLYVKTPQNRVINLKSLFISKRRYCSYLIEKIVKGNGANLGDKDIQALLSRKGLWLSARTICNCRKLSNIPNCNIRSVDHYAKGICFSDYIVLSKKHLYEIPAQSGVYEVSIPTEVEYLNNNSNIIYIGSSMNLRKRMTSYLGKKLKNSYLKEFMNNNGFMRFCLVENYMLEEKKLLKKFKDIYGELPKANRLGG